MLNRNVIRYSCIFCGLLLVAATVEDRNPIRSAKTPEMEERVPYVPVDASLETFLEQSGESTITRLEHVFPDLGNYRVYTGEFHIHTTYSDGSVTPEYRVWEAWRDGLDILCITDHVEHFKYPEDVGRGYLRAKVLADQLGIVLIRSCEGGAGYKAITPGHLIYNFLKNEKSVGLLQDRWEQVFFPALREVRKQGGTINWAHPGTEWKEEIATMVKEDLIDGIEIKNATVSRDSATAARWGCAKYPYRKNYMYPPVLEWTIQNNLAVFAVSDAHRPVNEYPSYDGQRPFTMVLAQDSKIESLYNAVKARRTLACFDGMIWGRREWLDQLWHTWVTVEVPDHLYTKKSGNLIQLKNHSSFAFDIEIGSSQILPQMTVTLQPNTITSLPVRQASRESARTDDFEIVVHNLLHGAELPMRFSYSL